MAQPYCVPRRHHYFFNFEGHVKDLTETFDRLLKAQLKLKASKCFLFKKELTYLGLLITRDGIKPDLTKIRALNDMPTPKNKLDVRSFLGLCNYNRNFIPDILPKVTSSTTSRGIVTTSN